MDCPAMDRPAVDLSSIPMLETPVGQYGSIALEQAVAGTTSTIELTITVLLIVHG